MALRTGHPELRPVHFLCGAQPESQTDSGPLRTLRIRPEKKSLPRSVTGLSFVGVRRTLPTVGEQPVNPLIQTVTCPGGYLYDSQLSINLTDVLAQPGQIQIQVRGEIQLA